VLPFSLLVYLPAETAAGSWWADFRCWLPCPPPLRLLSRTGDGGDSCSLAGNFVVRWRLLLVIPFTTPGVALLCDALPASGLLAASGLVGMSSTGLSLSREATHASALGSGFEFESKAPPAAPRAAVEDAEEEVEVANCNRMSSDSPFTALPSGQAAGVSLGPPPAAERDSEAGLARSRLARLLTSALFA
jgi:hypothetical protein